MGWYRGRAVPLGKGKQFPSPVPPPVPGGVYPGTAGPAGTARPACSVESSHSRVRAVRAWSRSHPAGSGGGGCDGRAAMAGTRRCRPHRTAAGQSHGGSFQTTVAFLLAAEAGRCWGVPFSLPRLKFCLCPLR